MSKVKNIVHIVFSTKGRQPAIPINHKRDLFAFIFGLLKERKCFLFRINGMADHIHMLIALHPTIALSDLVRDVKQISAIWMLNNPVFPNFTSWNEGYYAASVGEREAQDCIDYIINQETHHAVVSLVDESQMLAAKYGLEWHSKDWN